MSPLNASPNPREFLDHEKDGLWMVDAMEHVRDWPSEIVLRPALNQVVESGKWWPFAEGPAQFVSRQIVTWRQQTFFAWLIGKRGPRIANWSKESRWIIFAALSESPKIVGKMIPTLVIGDPACFDGECQTRVGDVTGQPQRSDPADAVQIRALEEAA